MKPVLPIFDAKGVHVGYVISLNQLSFDFTKNKRYVSQKKEVQQGKKVVRKKARSRKRKANLI